jgi:membrane protein implicated in regulation of membrane protease activity
MNTHVAIIRAISSEFITRKCKTLILIAGGISLIALLVTLWLTTLSPWWWLLAALIISFVIIEIIAILIARTLLKKLQPMLSKIQASHVVSFVDKLEKVAENVQLSPFIVMYRVIRDLIYPSDKTFISELASSTSLLHSDFVELQKSFK